MSAGMPSTAQSPAIGEHRLLGNGHSCALVTPAATVDWWCAPDVDSTPLLWSLLDGDGGRAEWVGARMVERAEEPAGPTTRTTLAVDGARVEVWDGLVAVAGGGSALVRLVRRVGGAGRPDATVEIVHRLTAGGFDQPQVDWEGSSGRVPGHDVTVTGGSSTVDGPALCTRLVVDGEWSALVVAVGATVAAEVDVLRTAMSDAEAAAGAALDAASLPHHHPERVRDALAVLEACTFMPTGAAVASPTTSLPEAPGADRQFDYRYSWLRDASLAVSVASLLGRRQAAERYLAFVVSSLGDDGVPSGPMTDVRGGDVPDEREVDGVAGWAGSQPIRVGNGAADQQQYDALGLLLEAVSVHLQTGGSLDGDTWDLVSKVADAAADEDGSTPSNGIWELREAKLLVSGDLGRWIALDRAIWIARGWRPWTRRRRRRWLTARAEVRRRILDALDEDGVLPQAYDDDPPRLDASALMAVLFGLLPPSDPRAAALVDAVIAGLGAGPHLYRYEPDATDGFAGREGAFVPMGWWAAAALAAVGRVDEASERVDRLCAQLPRLLSEEVDPERDVGLGNVPLLWSHVEAARTMYLLDAATRRRRYGSAGLWAWRLGRYVALRAGRSRDGDLTALPELTPAPRSPSPSPSPGAP